MSMLLPVKTPRPSPWIQRQLLLVVISVCIVALVVVQFILLQYAGGETALDHTKTTLFKPFYRLTCHDAWTANGVSRPLSDAACAKQKPRIVMISARLPHERAASSVSWKGDEIYMVDTRSLSAQLEPRLMSECPAHSWSYRLFLIYQTTFKRLLEEFPDEEDFVMLEDDAILADAEGFAREVCRAQAEKLLFFSLYYVSDRQDACIYHSGTVAFYLTRAMMEKIIRVPLRARCRLPIDIYLSTSGPWSATELSIIRHNSKRVGS